MVCRSEVSGKTLSGDKILKCSGRLLTYTFLLAITFFIISGVAFALPNQAKCNSNTQCDSGHCIIPHTENKADGRIVVLKAGVNNKYVTAENGGADALIANRDAIGPWEQFTIVDAGSGYIALKANINNKYVTAENGGADALIANRDAIGPWEQFTIVDAGSGYIALKANINNKYVTAENGGASSLIANRDAIGLWEKFQLINTSCTPNSVSGCKVCSSDGTAWIDTDSKCNTNQKCINGDCLSGVCCNTGQCGYITTYAGGSSSGACYDSGVTLLGSVCSNEAWKNANGKLCKTDAQCNSGKCLNGVCCNTGQCGFTMTNGGITEGSCYDSGKEWVGLVCSNEAWKKANRKLCSADAQCNSGRCLSGVCCNTGQCGFTMTNGGITEGSCYDSGKEWVGLVCSNEAWKNANGKLCKTDAQCNSGKCLNGVCCNTGQCGFTMTNGGITEGSCQDIGMVKLYNTCHNEGQWKGLFSSTCTSNSQCLSNLCIGGYCADWTWGTAYTLNATGDQKNSFKDCCSNQEEVYVKLCMNVRTYTPPVINYAADPYIYVVPDNSYIVGARIPADITEAVEFVDIPQCPSAITTKIWGNTRPGNYRVISDVDMDGFIDANELLDQLKFSVYTCECPIPKGSLKIKKTCENCNKISGITFTVTGPNSFSTQVITNSEGYSTLDNLIFGTYTITESVPAGYEVITQNPQNIIIDSQDQKVATFTNKEKVIPKGSLKIKKTCENCNKISGITFTVTGPNSFSTQVITNSEGYSTLDNLIFGTYTITESVPAGYEVITQNPQNIIIDSQDQKVATFTNKEKVIPKGSLKIKKRLSSCSNPIMPGVLFTITGPNGYKVNATTNANGEIILSNLVFGTYTITESVPVGYYAISQNPQNVVINSETQKVITIYNGVKVPPKGSIKITKTCTCEPTNSSCSGSTCACSKIAGFNVTGPNGFKTQVTTSSTGYITISSLEYGTYTIIESVPAGYVVTSQNPQKVELNSSGKIVSFSNKKLAVK